MKHFCFLKLVYYIIDEWTVKGAKSKTSKQHRHQNQQNNLNIVSNGRGRGTNRNGHVVGQGRGGEGRGSRNGNTSLAPREHQSSRNGVASSMPSISAQPQPQTVPSSLEKPNVPKFAWVLNNKLTISNNTTNLQHEDVVSSKPEKRRPPPPPTDENKLNEFPLKPAKRFSLGEATKFSTNHYLITWPANNGFDFENIRQYDVTIREQKSAQKRVVESTALGM
jgi:hypothetical protein